MSERERKVGSVTYKEVGEEYFKERGLRRHAGVWSLWALGVGAVISGDFYGWNAGCAGVAGRQGVPEELSAAGEIDTVLCMFTDLQGRFMGKRVVPHFFLEEVLGEEEGLHACLYLLAIDMEMELPGYEFASWETGYGDFRMVPDVSTLRWCPWLEKTAMVICDVADEDTGEPVEVAPRRDPEAGQIRRRAAEKGFVIRTGSELEFYLFRDGYDDIADGGTATSARAPRTSWTTTCCRPPRTNGSSGRSATGCSAPDSHRVLEGRVRQGAARR